MQNNQPASLGSTGANAFFWVAPLPTVVAEWAALIPLIFHLASSQDDHHLVSEMSLRGRLTTGMFPKLGQLSGIARLLNNGPEFLDCASGKGALSSVVRDVSWGSVFPCANGAARSIFTNHAMRSAFPAIDVEQWSANNVANSPSSLSTSYPSTTISTPSTITGSNMVVRESGSDVTTSRSVFRRPQTLHVFNLCRRKTSLPIRSRWHLFLSSQLVEILWLLSHLGLTVGLCLVGAYGSASIVLSNAVSRAVCQHIPIERPPGYLENNELHDACMLAATHENASTWFLYTGDRGVADWLLNKTMITIRPSGRLLYYYFRLAHGFQLLATTYVAAQKGWDGVCLFLLLLSVWIVHWSFGLNRPAAAWAQKEGIQVESQSFKLTGRIQMIGAIQLVSDRRKPSENVESRCRNVAWMDGILAPCARRSAWTDLLLKMSTGGRFDDTDLGHLEKADQQWVKRSTEWARVAACCIATEMSKISETAV